MGITGIAFKTLVLIFFITSPALSQSEQGGAPGKYKQSVDQLNAEDFAPKPKPEEPKPGPEPKKPARPAPSKETKQENRAARSHSPGDVWREPVTGMEFVWVPAGCYQMGCGSWTSDCLDDEKPVHEVCVNGFWMGKHEVTQGQWQRVMGNNPSRFVKGTTYPVENVSWNDAQEFIRKLEKENGGKFDFRLPTEAEWEYACRSGGKGEKFSGESSVDSVAWYEKNSGSSTHMVGTKSANGLGLYDMSGNVREWVEDVYDGLASSKHPRQNPVITSGGLFRVNRGGGWYYRMEDARCGNRTSIVPERRGPVLGFRLARSD